MKKRPIKKKVGLLGGTFNPPHLGHLYIAKELYSEFSLDEIVFIPVGDPPHKTDKRIAPAQDRINMLSLMISDYPYMSVSAIEIERTGYTYTIDTLTDLTKTFGNTCEFFYIIGSDTLFLLKTWKRFEQVFLLTSFLCVPRPGDPQGDIEKEISFLKSAYSARIFLSEHIGPDISSTEIRDDMNYRTEFKTQLSENVWEYIIKNHVFDK